MAPELNSSLVDFDRLVRFERLKFGLWLLIWLFASLIVSDWSKVRAEVAVSAPLVPSEVALAKVAPRSQTVRFELPAPVRLEIPTQNIDLAVAEGHYSSATGQWNLDKEKLLWMAKSASPASQAGQTVIYGHNTPLVLGKTSDLQPGDELILWFADGGQQKYRFREKQLVAPDQVEVLDYQATRHQLMLLSCDGEEDEHRRLMFFDLILPEDAHDLRIALAAAN